jgi:hypothetical protein
MEAIMTTTPRSQHRDDCAIHFAPQECECNCGQDVQRCYKCDAEAVTDDDGDPMCARCYGELPEIDDCWAYSS